ncbi:MAG: potassium channel family protein [Thermohalobaculum sp.]|nr:potassium channel family protein [Thermohalobaculum sp.]
MILQQLAIGLGAIAATVAIHATFMAVALAHVQRRPPRTETALHKALFIVAVVMWFFLSICIQCWGWAVLLRWLGALGDFEEALYFVTVSFTTVGYGDIVLGPDWRLLGAFAAVNGTIILGWTTALVFLAVQRAYLFDRTG